MPVHKVGYRGWEGKKVPSWRRWWIITETGFRIAFKSNWVKRILLIAWLPVLYWGVALFAIERGLSASADSGAAHHSEVQALQAELAAEIVNRIEDDFDIIPNTESLKTALDRGGKREIRHAIWLWLLLTFFRYPQGFAMLFLLGIVVPGLISRDVRSRAFLMYFSRPIGRLDYILGKFMIPTIFLALITLIPALCLYLLAVTLSPNTSVIWATWDIPLRIVAASISLIIPTCSIALMLSAITQESRFATFAWFTVWALGYIAWFAIIVARSIRLEDNPFGDKVMNDPIVKDWSVVSLYNNFSAVQNWIFGMTSFAEVWPSVAVLVCISIASLIFLYRGVSAPIKV